MDDSNKAQRTDAASQGQRPASPAVSHPSHKEHKGTEMTLQSIGLPMEFGNSHHQLSQNEGQQERPIEIFESQQEHHSGHSGTHHPLFLVDEICKDLISNKLIATADRYSPYPPIFNRGRGGHRFNRGRGRGGHHGGRVVSLAYFLLNLPERVLKLTNFLFQNREVNLAQKER